MCGAACGAGSLAPRRGLTGRARAVVGLPFDCWLAGLAKTVQGQASANMASSSARAGVALPVAPPVPLPQRAVSTQSGRATTRVGATCCRACGAGWPHGLTRACCLVAGDGVRGVSRECSTDMCVHKRRRYYCRDCQGAGACEHNNRRWRCRECNGAYTCEHGLIKTNCLQCELEKAGPKPLDDEKKLEGHVVPPAPQDHLGQLQPPPPPLEQGGDVQMGVSGGVVAALAPAALSTLPPSALVGLPVEGKEGDAVEAASLVPPAASAPPPHGASGLQSEEDEANLSRVCMHKRWRVFCAECGGSGLCDHGKRKGPFLLTAPLASLASPCPASPDARFLCLPCPHARLPVPRVRGGASSGDRRALVARRVVVWCRQTCCGADASPCLPPCLRLVCASRAHVHLRVADVSCVPVQAPARRVAGRSFASTSGCGGSAASAARISRLRRSPSVRTGSARPAAVSAAARSFARSCSAPPSPPSLRPAAARASSRVAASHTSCICAPPSWWHAFICVAGGAHASVSLGRPRG